MVNINIFAVPFIMFLQSLSWWLVLFFWKIVVRAIVPRMELDSLFEQKNDVAKSVLEELEKVTPLTYFPCYMYYILPWHIVTCI
jgi:hypothetical protein